MGEPIRKFVLLFDGTAIASLMEHVCRQFPHHSPCVVTANAHAPNPRNLALMGVKDAVQFLQSGDFEPRDIVVVLNGAVTELLIPVLLQLVKGWSGFHGSYQLVELRPMEHPPIRVFDKREEALSWKDKPPSCTYATEIYEASRKG
jgi:hypothetical protein